MAATERIRRGALRALMLAAAALPGMVPVAHAQEEQGAGTQGGVYVEGKRDLGGPAYRYDPVRSEHLRHLGDIRLSDRWRLGLEFAQDTWSGATPIGTGPRAFGMNNLGFGTSSASPYLQPGGATYIDAAGHPLVVGLDPDTFELTFTRDDQLVHTMSVASPETRREGSFRLSRLWERRSLELGAGASQEHDFRSRFASLTHRWEVENRRTQLSAGASYTQGRTEAKLDPDGSSYIWDSSLDMSIFGNNGFNTRGNGSLAFDESGDVIVSGERRDLGLHAGLTRVMSRSALLEAGLGWSRATGYLGNPYKVTSFGFIDTSLTPGPAGELPIQVASLLEQRPRERDQGTLSLKWVQHMGAREGALHLGYRFYRDDWSIAAHTLDASWEQPLGHGLTVTPRVRYYSQSAARFYVPFAMTRQAFLPQALDGNGRPLYRDIDHPESTDRYWIDDATNELVDQAGNRFPNDGSINIVSDLQPVDRSRLPGEFSSDPRLSAFGALSGGVTVLQRIRPGLAAELSWEYYRHAGELRLGGGGEGRYADFHHTVLNAALRLDLGGAPGEPSPPEESVHAGHAAHAAHVGAPAGLMGSHVLLGGERFMAGYHAEYRTWGGGLRHGRSRVSDADLAAATSSETWNVMQATRMRMTMHMFDLMAAVTPRMMLMVTPTFVDMDMSMRATEGVPFPGGDPGMMLGHMAGRTHAVGGIGDLSVRSLIQLAATSRGTLVGGVGLRFPAGRVGRAMAGMHGVSMLYDYDMQEGSGTLDLLPSLAWSAPAGRGVYGAQLSGERRLEQRNAAGFRFGHVAEASLWMSAPLRYGFAGSARGTWRSEGFISGAFTSSSPITAPGDLPQNHGGRFADLALGVSREMPGAAWRGHRLSAEVALPVLQDVNGYQLSRRAVFTLAWQRAF